jgi:hypothetical protein
MMSSLWIQSTNSGMIAHWIDTSLTIYRRRLPIKAAVCTGHGQTYTIFAIGNRVYLLRNDLDVSRSSELIAIDNEDDGVAWVGYDGKLTRIYVHSAYPVSGGGCVSVRDGVYEVLLAHNTKSANMIYALVVITESGEWHVRKTINLYKTQVSYGLYNNGDIVFARIVSSRSASPCDEHQIVAWDDGCHLCHLNDMKDGLFLVHRFADKDSITIAAHDGENIVWSATLPIRGVKTVRYVTRDIIIISYWILENSTDYGWHLYNSLDGTLYTL